MSTYVPLWCKSNFSFLEGASRPDELCERADELGLSALALCDRDGVYGAVRAHQAAKERGARLIHGSEVSLNDGGTVVLLVQDRVGWASLCRLLTRGRLRSANVFSTTCRLSSCRSEPDPADQRPWFAQKFRSCRQNSGPPDGISLCSFMHKESPLPIFAA